MSDHDSSSVSAEAPTPEQRGQHQIVGERFRVGLFVYMEVEAMNRDEAGLVAERALGFPNEASQRLRPPVRVEGTLNQYVAVGHVIYAQTLMARPLEDGEDPA